MKKGLIVRQRAALKRLESAYETFKAGGKDKKSWNSRRNRSYNEECERFKKEITILKEKLSKEF